MKKYYKDLYKLEKGTYFLRIDPDRMSSIEMEIIANIFQKLKEDKEIEIIVAYLPKDSIEFLPAKKQDKTKRLKNPFVSLTLLGKKEVK